MKKKFITLCTVIFLLFQLAACKSNSVKIVVASDIHYLASELYDDGDAFMSLLRNDDGKATMYVEEIVDKFIDEMLKLKPKMVVLSGDISFEGERLSHEKLADKLSKLTDKGIKVAVMPGNHDLNNNSASGYSGDESYKVDSVSASEFKEIYGAFGYGDALYTDEDSMSYIAEVNENTWVVLVDVNGNSDPLHISASTIEWLRDKLDYAKRHDITVFSFTHQNIVDHSLNSERYKLYDDNDELYYALTENGVKANFSGHSHFQHYEQLYGLKEIVTSSLSTYPCKYGVIEIKSNGIEYNTRELNVKHIEEIKQFFYDTVLNKEGNKLSDEKLRAYYLNILENYYFGSLDKIEVNEEYLEEIGSMNGSLYLEAKYISDQAGRDSNHVVIE